MSYALITGASSGIGVAFAKLFAADQIPLIIMASPRSQIKLEVLAQELQSKHGIDVKILTADLSTEKDVKDLISAVDKLNLDVDYLVNNAGFGIVGKKIYDYDPVNFYNMIKVNVLALSVLCMHFIPTMVARDKGKVLNVSSIAGYVIPHGLEAGYAASKAYVVSFSENVSDDLRGTNVTCTHLAPGPVRTNFFDRGGMKDSRQMEKLFMSPEAVAEAGYRAMMKGKSSIIPGKMNKIFKLLAWISPSKFLTGYISGKIIKSD